MKNEDGQIQADFARRVGQILLQYDSSSGQVTDVTRYDATLVICLLQTLVINCQQLIRNKSKLHNELISDSKKYY